MRIGDRYLKIGSDEIHTLVGFSIYTDGVCLQNEAKDDDGSCAGIWDRPMIDDDGKEFDCEGFSSGYGKHVLLDAGLFKKVVGKKDIDLEKGDEKFKVSDVAFSIYTKDGAQKVITTEKVATEKDLIIKLIEGIMRDNDVSWEVYIQLERLLKEIKNINKL